MVPTSASRGKALREFLRIFRVGLIPFDDIDHLFGSGLLRIDCTLATDFYYFIRSGGVFGLKDSNGTWTSCTLLVPLETLS